MVWWIHHDPEGELYKQPYIAEWKITGKSDPGAGSIAPGGDFSRNLPFFDVWLFLKLN